MQQLEVMLMAVSIIWHMTRHALRACFMAALRECSSGDLLYLVNEEVPTVVCRVYHASLLDFTPDAVAEGVLVLLSAEVSNVAGR